MRLDATITVNGALADVAFTRELPTTADTIWSALTDPNHVARWLAELTIEPRIGGAITLVWPGEGEMNGVLDEFDAPHALGYSWQEGATVSHVRWSISNGLTDALLGLDHLNTPVREAIGFAAGWQSHLEALDAFIDGEPWTREQTRDRYHELSAQYRVALPELAVAEGA